MNVLLIGSGGREHALARALSASPLLTKLYCAPGNGGIAEIAQCVDVPVADHTAVMRFCKDHDVGLVVIGPEAPLVAGLVDDLTTAGIKCFGPSQAAARLEASKGYAKDLAREFKIPTAAYERFTDAGAAKAYIARRKLPLVVKADGLAAGKGVMICETRADAEAAVEACFSGAFGRAGTSIVVEEFLNGEEASFFVLADGEHVLPLATVQDHKRVGDGDKGPNTGGMGAYSPAPVMTQAVIKRTMEEIITPTIAAMAARGIPYRGVLFAGLMITREGPKLIEYNVRFGDPEAQVLLMRLKSDLLPALIATADGSLDEIAFEWLSETALAVVLAAKGYPGTPETGSEIKGLEAAAATEGVEIFHAGTKRVGDRLLAAGGRVLNVAARGRTVREAQARAYAAIAKIDWPGGFCRSDIGWRAIARETAEA